MHFPTEAERRAAYVAKAAADTAAAVARQDRRRITDDDPDWGSDDPMWS